MIGKEIQKPKKCETSYCGSAMRSSRSSAQMCSISYFVARLQEVTGQVVSPLAEEFHYFFCLRMSFTPNATKLGKNYKPYHHLGFKTLQLMSSMSWKGGFP